MILAISTAKIKKRVKKSFKKKEKIYGYQKLSARQFELGPSESVTSKSSRLCPLDHLGKRVQFAFKRGIYSFSMVIDSFQG